MIGISRTFPDSISLCILRVSAVDFFGGGVYMPRSLWDSGPCSYKLNEIATERGT
jgi:hypothetical protein